MSYKKSLRTRSARRNFIADLESATQIKEYFKGNSGTRPWDLSQEEANEIYNLSRRTPYDDRGKVYENLMTKYALKSPGAKWMLRNIWDWRNLDRWEESPDLYTLTREWFAHRNIKKSLSKEEIGEIETSPTKLRELGIRHGWEARKFYELYSQLRVKDRPWGSCYQVSQQNVLRMATTPNYGRLPLWVKKTLIESGHVETERIGNIWRLISCAKAWKHSPDLPKNLAEKVGKMPAKSRILSTWAWQKTDHHLSREENTLRFWEELRRLSRLDIFSLVNERVDRYANISKEDHYKLKLLTGIALGLPHGYVDEEWPDHSVACPQNYRDCILSLGDSATICLQLFGNSGKKTQALFQKSTEDQWKWAWSLGDGNPDLVHRILMLDPIIKHQTDAVGFLMSLPVPTRLRLLGATTFKYRGETHPISDDHVRDTGYLWSNIQNKPELGRIRCWFSVHEALAAAYVKELPDEELPVDIKWQPLDGLSSISQRWELVFPTRVATLKYWGEHFHNCVGGYGNAIKSGRSVVFAVKEYGVLTHCVEVTQRQVNQFYRSRNSPGDKLLIKEVSQALTLANLID